MSAHGQAENNNSPCWCPRFWRNWTCPRLPFEIVEVKPDSDREVYRVVFGISMLMFAIGMGVGQKAIVIGSIAVGVSSLISGGIAFAATVIIGIALMYLIRNYECRWRNDDVNDVVVEPSPDKTHVEPGR